jgi:mRNA interferase MazF
MSRYKQGDIVLLNFPFSDNNRSKIRPALILSNDKLDGNFYNEKIFIPISTKKQEDGFDIEIQDKMVKNVMPKRSFLRYMKLQTMPESQIEINGKISELRHEHLKEVVDKINELVLPLDEGEDAMPEWHNQLVEERMAKYERNDSKLKDWDKVQENLGVTKVRSPKR